MILQLEVTIGAMETAFRMQTEAPDVFDVRKESDAVIKMYGEGSTARGCLTAARLIERGVRMVQVYYAKGDPWDHHFDIEQHRKTGLGFRPAVCRTDQGPEGAWPLRRNYHRGWLRVWPYSGCRNRERLHGRPNVRNNGRDHNPHGFTMWLAGGGFKRGFTYGATDDFGWKAVENPVHVHDIHATILYQLGIDHTKLTYH